MARLFGVPAASPATARVLELGCGTGANLLPMADAFPLATFVGIDPVAASIDVGQRFAKAAGLTNVELRHEDFTAFSAPGKKFDYIIIHGVYSRVPEATQQRLWDLCREYLADNGIAFFSYNVLPGANLRRSMRDITTFHTGGLAQPAAKVKQARAILKFLSEAVPGDDNAYGVMLRNELDFASKANDRVVYHDYLAPDQSAVYFHEFAGRAEANKLQYVCEATFSDMLAANFPEAVSGTLARIDNIVAQEQYMDFLRNRMFRQTLLCRGGLRIQRKVGPDTLKSLAFQAVFTTNSRQIDLAPGAVVVFSTANGQQISTGDAFTKAALSFLSENALRAVGFNELLEAARARSRPLIERPAPDLAAIEEASLAVNLLSLLSKGFIDLYAEASQGIADLPAKPKVSEFHRLQARTGTQITSRLNFVVPVDALGRVILGHCDGTRTSEQLIALVVREAQNGMLQVQQGKKPLRDAAKLQALLAPQARNILQNLARGGFFLAPAAA
jgi:methyltransferase-like protein/SAM-dependent methyltransferase